MFKINLGEMIDKKMLLLIIVNATVAVCLLVVNFLIFSKVENIFFALNMIVILIFALPIILAFYTRYKKKKELEELFPVFLRDFVEAVRSGLNIPQAFKSVSKNDYRSLTPYIKKIAMQLDWGIPVEEVLTKFANQTKSKVIGRVVSSVIESQRFGGNLANTFQALSETAVEVEKLRAERRMYLQSQLITGYIIFFVFLAVIIGLEKFLVPSLTQNVGITSSMPTGAEQTDLAKEYKVIFMNLILLQGLFAGLCVGKMAEGAIIAGIKHSIFMTFAGVLIFIAFG